ncbi:MAG: hypothetical protein RL264_1431 [Bacteroidota bacterium]|jgi:gliding motility-associated-like protein
MKKHLSAVRHELQKITFFSALFLSVGITAFGQIPNYVPSNGLVGWWPFNGNANDESGNGNNGTVNGAVSLTTDRNGNQNAAYSFPGNSSEYIDINQNASFANFTNGFSLSVWYLSYTDNSPGRMIALGNTDGCNIGFHVSGFPNSGATLVGSSCIAFGNWDDAINNQIVNTWSNLVFTVNLINNEWTIYNNGVVATSGISTSSISLPLNLSSYPFNIGRKTVAAFDSWNGKVDDIGIWNRALSACEISALYSGQTLTPPIVNLGSDTLNICGLNTTLDATNPAAASYSWNTGETTPNIIVSSTGEYHVTVTDSAGCSSSDTIYVSVIDPTITAGQSAFCLGDSTTLSINTNGNTCGNLTGSLQNGLVGWWPFCGNANDESGNGNNGVVSGATLTSDRFGSANNAYDFNGNAKITCPQNNIPSQNLSLSVWINQDISFANIQYVCLGSSASTRWGAVASNNNLYVGYGAGCSGTGGNSLNNTPLSLGEWIHLVYVSTGVGGNTKIYKNGVYAGQTQNSTSVGSCSTSNIYFGVDIFSLPEFINGKLDDIGIWNRELTAQEIQELYNQGNLSSWWSDGTTNQTSIQVQPTQTTTYSVTVSDGVGSCTDSITIQVNNPQINAGSDISICEGDSTTLTASGASTYVWDNGVVNGQAFVPTVEGYYNVTGTDTLGCSNSASIFLDLLQPTSSSISPVNCVTYTAPDGAVYTNSGQYTAVIPNAVGCDSTISINLTINNVSIGTDTKVACDSFTWIDGVTYTENNTSATYTLQNEAGCDSVVTLNLTINKLLNLNAGTDQVVCKGENVILVASGAETYNWNNGVSDGVAFSPPLGTTTYTVTGTDGNGCTDTDEVSITAEYCFEIPGALSPNGDNTNDTWEISGLTNYPNAVVLVFDRWGQKVYDGTSTSAPWNGKYQDKDLPTADYYYIIELGNGDTYNGVVTLKR